MFKATYFPWLKRFHTEIFVSKTNQRYAVLYFILLDLNAKDVCNQYTAVASRFRDWRESRYPRGDS